MNSVSWTKEQEQAINEKGRNILIAAAAGSGKTAVLVERIIRKIIYEKIDIDKMLIVTFTNAAASEMRERILEAIYKKLEENPNDMHLQKQLILLNKASICTIHSFCLDVIKNNFFEIDISPNFRIGDNSEIELLKQDVLEDIFEEKYLDQNPEFIKLIENYATYRGDEHLKEIILNIFNFIQSSPFPEEWLRQKVEMFNIKDINIDFSNTLWGKVLLKNYKQELENYILGLNSIKKELDKNLELNKYSDIIKQDIENLQNIILNINLWDRTFELSNLQIFNKWPSDRKIISNIKENSKEKRDQIKKQFNRIRDSILIYDSKEANIDIKSQYYILNSISNIVIEFQNEFSKRKKEKNIIDFNDIEHYALNILVKKDENGNYIQTDIAKKYMGKFVEIAIDEYQDSNLVQEYILNKISNNKNLFMVGDVKQSIYKFRQARPELFLEKYNIYELEKNSKDDSKGLKIKLFKNFRSRKNILDITNMIFENIMSKDLGDIEYNKEEYLNFGANYPILDDKLNNDEKIELNIINTNKIDEEKNEELDEEIDNEIIEDVAVEAKFVSKKIVELINSDYKIFDKKEGYRNIKYKDIVILLRATSNQAPIYEKELSELNIPVFSDSSTEYLESVEVQTMMSLLKIIDNPTDEISLVDILRSNIGGFSDNELIKIRLSDKYSNFYEALLKSRIQVEDDLKTKIDKFLDQLEKWREEKEYKSLDELIWNIYLDTGYYNYVGLMQNGEFRQANLKMLFEKAKQYEKASFKGLFNFIKFIDKLKLSNNDLGAARLIGENENVVRIMSIHKSKGLEFPICFLCGTSKKFNMQDLNQTILLHQDIGLGPKVIDHQRTIEYNTLAKETLKEITKLETLSEEMRVLYVALTRAKEKLIITGIAKNIEKELEEKESLLKLYNNKNKINMQIIKRYKSYLDWIELVYIKNKECISDMLDFNIYSKDDILKDNPEKQNDNNTEILLNNMKNNRQIKQEIIDLLEWKYDNIESTKIPTKASVSKIKKMENLLNIEEIEKTYDIYEDKSLNNINMSAPKFLNIEQEITNVKKGTLMHLCLQRLNENIDYTLDDIKELIGKLVKNEIITDQEAKNINIRKIYKFTKSNIYNELKGAKEIYKEKPFYINIKAKEIYDVEAEDEILVQGIIDLYYIDKDNHIVLVDYKTDFVPEKDEKILIEKYSKQLELYRRALEESYGKKVDKVYIYSTYLDKEIKIL